MPRKPTGRPTGRPKGGPGTLGEVKPLTVRLPMPLYQKLELFAEGRAFHRGVPELSGCVRELLEYALAGMSTRQTMRTPAYSNGQTVSDTLQKTENDTAEEWGKIQQTGSDSLQQTRSIPPVSLAPEDLDAMPLGVSVAMAQEPAYDPQTDELGPLCANNHDWKGTGQSPRRTSDNECRQCRRDRDAAYKARKRQAAPVA